MQGSRELGPGAHDLRALTSTFLVEGPRPQVGVGSGGGSSGDLYG